MTPAVYPSLAGRTAVVTGGGSGIGAEIVAGFARQQAQVYFVDADAPRSLALVEQLGGAVQFLHCDLTDLDALAATFATIAARAGPVAALVNNAASDDRHAIEAVTPAYWDERIAVNLRHYFFAAQAVVGGMRGAGGGSIVNLGSASWHLALPGFSVYQTAKAGVEGLTRSFARDLGGDNIRVNCVIPGAIRTPRQTALWHTPEEEAGILGKQCLKVRVEPVDVAAMVLFLASDDARYCTGHSYWVDAGYC